MEDRARTSWLVLPLAVRLEGLLRYGTVQNHVERARLGGVSRSRVTQILNLRNLAPVLQEKLLRLPPSPAGHRINERALRRIGGWADWRQQIAKLEELYPEQAPCQVR